jgi:cytochrome c553
MDSAGGLRHDADAKTRQQVVWRPSAEALPKRYKPTEARMMRMKTGILLTVVSVGMIGAVQAGTQDIEAGKKLYQSVCRNCHGPSAKGMASFPKLTGQSTEYLASRLEQYRAGEKVGANSSLMIPVAAKLSDDDIANLAAYITITFQ